MTSFAEFGHLVDSAYDLGTTTQDWTALAREIAVAFDSRNAVVVKDVLELGEGQAVGTWFRFRDHDITDAGPIDEFGPDPLMARVWAAKRGSLSAVENIFERREIMDSEFGREVLEPRRIGHTVHILMPTARGTSVFICLTRDPRQKPFSREQLGILEALAPHIARAIRIGEEVSEARSGPELMDLINCGIFLLDAAARPIRMNARARDLVSTGNGLSVKLGRLTLDGIELERRIAALTRDGPRFVPVTMVVPAAGSPMTAILAPPPGAGEEHGPTRAAAVLLVNDPSEAVYPGIADLQTQYGLTRREAGFTLAFTRTRGLRSAATELGISWETARRHLKSVFEKTDTHSQPELIHLLLRHPAVLLASH